MPVALPSHAVKIKMSQDTAKCFPSGKTTPVENHCPAWVTGETKPTPNDLDGGFLEPDKEQEQLRNHSCKLTLQIYATKPSKCFFLPTCLKRPTQPILLLLLFWLLFVSIREVFKRRNLLLFYIHIVLVWDWDPQLQDLPINEILIKCINVFVSKYMITAYLFSPLKQLNLTTFI